ncbi:MAG: outer membrane protein assembly factor BamC [Thiotrichales bacterium]|nr:outer membrane protein assembly factor BamC [Thiotrichales bacterium]
MRFAQKTLVASTLAMTFTLSGCSTFSSLFGSDDRYREEENKMVENLEMPPNLFNPGKNDNQLAPALKEAQKAVLASQNPSGVEIPTFRAQNVALKSNLSERWLELQSTDSLLVWNSLKRFLTDQGFAIAEERQDIGLLKTDYLSRSELAPVDRYDGTLTRLLNSWRPEVAKGAYDKFILRVATDGTAGVTRIYINHHEMIEPTNRGDSSVGGNAWQVRPYSPVLEAEKLLQAMVFFGSTEEIALAQLQASVQNIEVVEGEEFGGLRLQASMPASWDYLKSMVYRANWNLHKSNNAAYTMQVDVPEALRQPESFFSAFAFWNTEDKTNLPERLAFRLQENADQSVLVSVSALEGEKPLTPSQKRYVFERLGLLTK